MKSFVIRAINTKTGEFIYSRTNNVNQRLDRLRYNVASINGKGTAVFDRFKPFIGCDLTDVKFEVYKQIDFQGA